MDGMETTLRIREMGYNRTVIALTANAVVGQREAFLANGFNDFISKPIDIRQLDGLLNTYIRDKQPVYVLEAAKKAAAPEEAAAEAVTEEDTILTRLKTIEGLETDAALDAMSGLYDVYIDTIKLTARLLPERIEKMNAFVKDDMQKFTMEVHGLKSVLKNIGAAALGSQASSLESAALENNTAYCETRYPPFRDGLLKLHEGISAVLFSQDTAEKKNADPAALIPLLAETKAAAEGYDRDGALAIISPCANITYGGEADALVQSLINALESFDYEASLQHISTLENILQ
jgi:CheY-like chemotaxis protein